MKNHLFILLILSAFLRSNSFSQEMFFSPITSLNGSGFSIVPSNDGGYLGVGQLFHSLFESYVLIFKINETGGLQWYNTIESQGINMGYKIINTNDNNYLILASVDEAPSGFPSQPIIGTYFSKISSDGDIIWENTYSEEGPTYLLDVCQVSTNDFYFTGNNHGDGVVNTNNGAWVIKANNDGDTLWTKTLDNNIIAGNCVVPTFNDGCIVNGKDHFVYEDVVTGSNYQYPTPSFFKLNESGDIIWQNYLDTTRNIDFVSGATIDNYSSIFVGSTADYNSGNRKAFVVRIDEFGDTLWTKTIESISMFYSVSLYDDESTFVCGGHFYDGTRHIPAIAKIDFDGNLIWKKVYTSLFEDNRIWGIHSTQDGGAIAIGKYYNNNTGGVLILKTNSQGEYSSLGIDFLDLIQSSNISVYPNPVTDNATINLSGIDYTKLKISIYSFEGRVIHEQEFNHENQIHLDMNSYSNGVYNCILNFDDITSISKKIVKQ